MSEVKIYIFTRESELMHGTFRISAVNPFKTRYCPRRYARQSFLNDSTFCDPLRWSQECWDLPGKRERGPAWTQGQIFGTELSLFRQREHHGTSKSSVSSGDRLTCLWPIKYWSRTASWGVGMWADRFSAFCSSSVGRTTRIIGSGRAGCGGAGSLRARQSVTS
jgi:hypothetical protein